jgi:hypothetical protein
MRSLLRSTPSLTLSFVVLITPLANAGEIRVPSDYPNLTLALAAAAPNDVILVQTTTFQQSVVITQPVTIIGDPVCTIYTNSFNCAIPETVRLAGPGSGNVTIANANIYSGGDCSPSVTPIAGTGFSSLFLYDVQIPEPPAGVTGSGNGTSGIRTTGIPFVALERCSVTSAQNDTDDCTTGGFAVQLGGKHNHAAVNVGHATLLALDSTLRGGNGGFMCTKNWVFFPSCVADLETAGGEGASAVKAGAFYAANSVVESGVGSSYLIWPGVPGGPGFVVCWVYGSHPAVIANTSVVLPGTAAAVGSPKPGATWQLDFALPAGVSYALFSFGAGAPISVPGLGTAFLDPGTFVALGPLSAAGGVGTASYGIPNDNSLLGVRLCLQPLHAGQGLLRPVTAAIVP